MGALRQKVLLIKPDFPFYSIGMAYVVAGLRRRGIDYDYFDARLDPPAGLEEMLHSNDYLAVATGGLIGSFTFFKRLLQSIKAIRPGLPCILGGNITHAVKPAQLLDLLGFDYQVLGEGELTLPDLLEALDRGDRFPADLPGLAFRNPDDPAQVVRTPARQRLDLFQDNWMPHWDAGTMNRYKVDAFPILSGRGCTGHCTFCAPTNGRFRGRPIEHILEEMEFLNTHFRFETFNFLNEILFSDEEDILRFCDEYQRLGLRKRWTCLLRIDLDPQVLGRMKEAGLCAVNVGVESGSDRVLKRIKKEITVAQTESFVRTLQKNNIFIEGSFMMAHLDERAEEVGATIGLMNRLDVCGPMALTINYPGTYNYRIARERGLIADEEQYIQSLDELYGVDPYDVITRHRSGRSHYLNLSAMTDDELFWTVEGQLRRYFTSNRAFQLQGVQVKTMDQPGQLQLAGTCFSCGTRITRAYDLKNFAIAEFRAPDCPTCGTSEIFIHPDAIPGFREHMEVNGPRILRAQRIALLGNAADVRWLLRHDLFHVDPDRIAGVIAWGGVRDAYALNHPIRPLDALLADGVDLVLVLNELPEEVLLEGLLEKVGWDALVFLTPSACAQAMASRPGTPEALALARAARPSPLDGENARHLDRRIRACLEAWRRRDARVVIHGAGAHTALLMACSPIREANLVGISDNNAALWGLQQFGFQVLAPREIQSLRPDVILISSKIYQEEIRDSLAFLQEAGIELVSCYE